MANSAQALALRLSHVRYILMHLFYPSDAKGWLKIP
jgi:hypothetical protein